MKLRELYNIFNQHPEGAWIMEGVNALNLYRFIKENPIKKILDLGTGIGLSSAVCALALKDKGETEGHIDSVEHSEKCIKIANELIPEELKSFITIHKTDIDILSFENIPYQYFSGYKEIPEGEYDLIINDGPPSFMKDEHYLDLPNGTITKLLIEGKIKPNTFVAWDGRGHMLVILERYYGDNFQVIPYPGTDLIILERLNDPLIFKDSKFESMRDHSTYFQ